MHGKAFVKHNNQPRKLLFDIKRSLLTCHKFTIVILNKIFKISEQCTLISVHLSGRDRMYRKLDIEKIRNI